jgi:membrane-associated phospholipid phosphatase
MTRSVIVLVVILMSAGMAAAQETGPAPPADVPAPATSDGGLLRKVFTTIARDIRRLPSKENVPTLLTGSVFALAAVPLDRLATYGASSSKVLKASYAGYGKAIGREWVQGGGALAGYVAGRLWDKPRLAAASGDLIEAQLVSATVTQGLKFLVSRTRPDGEARSFPSGHASAAFATASTLQRHFGRKAAIPAYAVAIYTSTSRLQANSHYPSDVIFGAALGIAIGRTATIDIGRQRLNVAPSVVPGGFAVVLTPARD